MAKQLSDTQLIILSAACQRDGARILPVTASLKGGAINMVLRSLHSRGLIEAVRAAAGDDAWAEEDGVPVTLTAKEFLLLRYLLTHRGRVLSRDRLLTDVWGYTYTGGTRTVDVHVRRLREKLPPLSTALVTVKQFGYKLVEEPVAAAPPSRSRDASVPGSDAPPHK